MPATIWINPDELSDDNRYIRVTYDVALGRGVCQQIRKAMFHVWGMPEDEIPDDNLELVEHWVNAVLDNTIDNDHEQLWECGEQGRGSLNDVD
jgi:hypothetical protein